MTQKWVWRRGKSLSGPLSADELKQMASKGILKPTDLVSRVGLEKWVPASDLQGLFPSAESGISNTPPTLTDSAVATNSAGRRLSASLGKSKAVSVTHLSRHASMTTTSNRPKSPLTAGRLEFADEAEGLPRWFYVFMGLAGLMLFALCAWIASDIAKSSRQRALAEANDTCLKSVALAKAALTSGDLDAAQQHIARAAAITEAEHQADVHLVSSEIDAARGLQEAESLISRHQLEAARLRIEEICETCKSTQSAETAAVLLDEILAASSPERLNERLLAMTNDEADELLRSGKLPDEAQLSHGTLNSILAGKCRELLSERRASATTANAEKAKQEPPPTQPTDAAESESSVTPSLRRRAYALPRPDRNLLSRPGEVTAGENEQLTQAKQVTIARYLRKFADRTRKHPFYGVEFKRSGGLPSEIPTVGTHSIEANQEAEQAEATSGTNSLEAARWQAWSNAFGALYHGTPNEHRWKADNNTTYLRRMGFDLRDEAFPYEIDGRSNTVPLGCKVFSLDDSANFDVGALKSPNYFRVWTQGNVEEWFDALMTREVAALRSKTTTLALQDPVRIGFKRALSEIEFGNAELPGLRNAALPVNSFEQIAELALTPVSTGKAGVVFPSWQRRQAFLSVVRDYYEKATDSTGREVYPGRFVESLVPLGGDPPLIRVLHLEKIDALICDEEFEKAFLTIKEAVSLNAEWAAKRKAATGNIRQYFVNHDLLVSSQDGFPEVFTKSLAMSVSAAPFVREIFRDVPDEAINGKTGRGLLEWTQEIDIAHQGGIARELFDAVQLKVLIDYAILAGNICPLPSADVILNKLLARAVILQEDPDAFRASKDSRDGEPGDRFF
jgi:hypothetical protein